GVPGVSALAARDVSIVVTSQVPATLIGLAVLCVEAIWGIASATRNRIAPRLTLIVIPHVSFCAGFGKAAADLALCGRLLFGTILFYGRHRTGFGRRCTIITFKLIILGRLNDVLLVIRCTGFFEVSVIHACVLDTPGRYHPRFSKHNRVFNGRLI